MLWQPSEPWLLSGLEVPRRTELTPLFLRHHARKPVVFYTSRVLQLRQGQLAGPTGPHHHSLIGAAGERATELPASELPGYHRATTADELPGYHRYPNMSPGAADSAKPSGSPSCSDFESLWQRIDLMEVRLHQRLNVLESTANASSRYANKPTGDLPVLTSTKNYDTHFPELTGPQPTSSKYNGQIKQARNQNRVNSDPQI